MPPSWASDSTISTPGSVGRPGKWPAKNSSSPVSCQWPRAETPGSTAVTSVTKRNGRPVRQDVGGSGQHGHRSVPILTAARALAAFLAAAFLAASADFLALAAFFAGRPSSAPSWPRPPPSSRPSSPGRRLLRRSLLLRRGAPSRSAAFLAGRRHLRGRGFVRRRPSSAGSASSATRRGGSNPARTNGRTSPFFSTCRALVGGGVPMAVSGM